MDAFVYLILDNLQYITFSKQYPIHEQHIQYLKYKYIYVSQEAAYYKAANHVMHDVVLEVFVAIFI